MSKTIDVSPRLQAMAETTFALETWSGRYSPQNQASKSIAPKKPLERKPEPSSRRLALAALLAALFIITGIVALRVESLTRSIDHMEAEIMELQTTNQNLETTITDLRDSNRALNLRLARLEAAARP